VVYAQREHTQSRLDLSNRIQIRAKFCFAKTRLGSTKTKIEYKPPINSRIIALPPIHENHRRQNSQNKTRNPRTHTHKRRHRNGFGTGIVRSKNTLPSKNRTNQTLKRLIKTSINNGKPFPETPQTVRSGTQGFQLFKLHTQLLQDLPEFRFIHVLFPPPSHILFADTSGIIDC